MQTQYPLDKTELIAKTGCVERLGAT